LGRAFEERDRKKGKMRKTERDLATGSVSGTETPNNCPDLIRSDGQVLLQVVYEAKVLELKKGRAAPNPERGVQGGIIDP